MRSKSAVAVGIFPQVDLSALIDDVVARVAVESTAPSTMPQEVDPSPFVAFLADVRG